MPLDSRTSSRALIAVLRGNARTSACLFSRPRGRLRRQPALVQHADPSGRSDTTLHFGLGNSRVRGALGGDAPSRRCLVRLAADMRRRLTRAQDLGIAGQRDAELDCFLVDVRPRSADRVPPCRRDRSRHSASSRSIRARRSAPEVRAAARLGYEGRRHFLEHGSLVKGFGSLGIERPHALRLCMRGRAVMSRSLSTMRPRSGRRCP